jgi:hypothetical protein
MGERPTPAAGSGDEIRRRLTDLLAAELAAACDRALTAGADARSLVAQVDRSLRRVRGVPAATSDRPPETLLGSGT